MISRGFNVNIPFLKSSVYDIVIEKDGVCKKIQIKTTYLRKERHSQTIMLREKYKRENVDLLCVFVMDTRSWYFFLPEFFHNKKTLSFNKKKINSFDNKENWTILYSMFE